MNLALLRHTWRAYRVRLLVVTVGLSAWGSLMPIVYDSFGAQVREVFESGLLPAQFAEFGGGDLFSLGGSVAIGVIHPIAVSLNLVFALGFATAAIAGERQRGTLEVLLSRPISRRRLYGTLALAALSFIGVAMAGLLAGVLGASALTGRLAELGIGNVPLLWLNGVLLYGALGAVALGASASFDRLTPAIGIGLAFVLVSYVFEVLGSLWPDARGLQPYSLFHYFDAKTVLAGLADPRDLAILAGVIAVAVGYALVVFPRRDLAAPS